MDILFLHFPSLANEISIFGFRATIYHLLQHGSTIIGAAIILYAIKRMPENKSAIAKPELLYWILIFVIMFLTIVIGQLAGQDYTMYGQFFITGIAGGLIGLILCSICWSKRKLKN
jgi:hypothetical protein